MKGLSELAQESWDVFRARFWLLWGVTGFGAAVTIAAAVAPLLLALGVQLVFSAGWRLWAVAVLVSLSAGLWLGSWAQIAAFEAVLQDEEPNMTECFARAWPKVPAFSWVCILYMVAAGGAFFFLILPGFFLAVALFFAPFVCLEEGLGGFAALGRSFDYARGRWAAVAGRLALIALAGMLPAKIPWIGWLLGMAVAPLPLVASARLYKDLRRAGAPAASARWPLALALAGWLVPAFLAVRVVPELVRTLPAWQDQLRGLGNIDAAKAQKLLLDIQSGDASSLDVAVQATKLLQDAQPAVAVSSGPAAGQAPR